MLATVIHAMNISKLSTKHVSQTGLAAGEHGEGSIVPDIQCLDLLWEAKKLVVMRSPEIKAWLELCIEHHEGTEGIFNQVLTLQN